MKDNSPLGRKAAIAAMYVAAAETKTYSGGRSGGKPIWPFPAPKPRPELLALAEQCGAVLTGKPDGSESITIVFTIEAWRKFDNATR